MFWGIIFKSFYLFQICITITIATFLGRRWNEKEHTSVSKQFFLHHVVVYWSNCTCINIYYQHPIIVPKTQLIMMKWNRRDSMDVAVIDSWMCY